MTAKMTMDDIRKAIDLCGETYECTCDKRYCQKHGIVRVTEKEREAFKEFFKYESNKKRDC